MKRYLVLAALILAAVVVGQKVNNSDVINLGAANFCSDSGGDDAYSCVTIGGAPNRITAYQTGQQFLLRVTTANTGGATADFGAGAAAIKVLSGGSLADPATGDICADCFVQLVYTGTVFQVLGNPSTTVGGGANPFAVSFTSQTSVTATHNAGTVNVTVACYNASSVRVEPQAVTVSSSNAVAITFLAAQSGYCVVNTGVGAAGASGSETAIAARWPYSIYGIGSITNRAVGSNVNTGFCNRFTLPRPFAWTGFRFRVTTALGSSCTGGTCGFVVALYNSTASSLLAASSVFTNSSATGEQALTWASGANVSSGTLTMPAGSYIGCWSTDSTALAVTVLVNNQYADQASHGYILSWSTGNGGSITPPASFTHAPTFSGTPATEILVGLFTP